MRDIGKIFIGVLLIILILFSDNEKIYSNESNFCNDFFTIIPGKCVGPITKKTGIKSLEKIFNHKDIKDKKIYDIEYSYFGTSIYENTKNEILIKWQDNTKEKPQSIYISNPETEWKTFEGITIGTTINELIKINGGHFLIWGCGFDYTGFIKSWNNGKLENSHNKEKIMIELDISAICSNKMVGTIHSSDNIINNFTDSIKVIKLIVTLNE